MSAAATVFAATHGLPEIIFLAGVGQLLLALGSLAIPRVLNWPAETARLRPLTRQVFWIYALYIWCSHLAFAALCMLTPAALADGSLLAVAVTTFLFLWWALRLFLQFAVLDRRDAPQGPLFRLAEAALVALFLCFTGVFGLACLSNVRGFVW